MLKLRAMIHYETRLQWRSRSWWVIGIGFVLFLLGGFLLTTSEPPDFTGDNADLIVTQTQNMERWYFTSSGVIVFRVADYVEPGQITPEYLARTFNTSRMMYGLWVGLVLILFASTLFMVEVIPLDAQYGTAALLHSLPLSQAAYLTGKLLSVWVNMLKVLALGGVAYGAAVWLMAGAYDLRVYGLVWAAVFVPAALMMSAVTVLVGCLVGTRRRAYLLGFLLMLPAGLTFVTAINDLWNVIALVDAFHRFVILPQPQLTDGEIIALYWQRLAGFTGIVMIAWGLAWAWRHWRVNQGFGRKTA